MSNALDAGFRIVPPALPNEGIPFVDHHAAGRSGHGGNCLVECANGDVLSFFSNTDGEVWDGHSVAGWSEHRRSTDGGEQWSDPDAFPYSERMWEDDDVYSALVFSVLRAPDDSLIAFVVLFESARWQKQRSPVFLRSTDHGRTWSEPQKLEPSAGPAEVAMTFDATFTKDDTVYAVCFGDDGNMGTGPYSLYVSTDDGRSFHRRSTLPFDERNYYVTAGVLEDGAIVVYSYSAHHDEVDERHVPYVISHDDGKTWSEVERTEVAKKIRNPQLSSKLDGRYFLHGRSGSYGDGANHLVLYSSENGIDWDDGIYLYQSEAGASGDCYSANAVIGHSDPHATEALLIQSSINYDPETKRVDERHWRIEPAGER